MNNRVSRTRLDQSLCVAVVLATAAAALAAGPALADPSADIPRQRDISLEHLQDRPIRVCVEAPPEIYEAVKGTVLNMLNDEFTIAKKRGDDQYPVVRVTVSVYQKPKVPLWILVVYTELLERADIQRLKDCNVQSTKLVKTWSFGHVDAAAPQDVASKVRWLVMEQTHRLLEAARGHKR